MKMKRVLSLLLALVMAFSLLTLPSYAEEEKAATLTVTMDGKAVDAVTLPQGGKVELKAQADAQVSDYCWQINIGGDTWVDIYGENAAACLLTFAKVHNVLDANGKTQVRCIAQIDDMTVVSDAVTVSVSDETPAPARKMAAKAAAPVKAPLLSETPTLEDEYTVTVNYIFSKNGLPAADPWAATVTKGSNLEQTIVNPTVVGYKATSVSELPAGVTFTGESVALNLTDISSDINITVTYQPDNVNYTVKYYQQNVEDDNYTLTETKTYQALTDSKLNPEVIEKTYEGFYQLPYDKEVTIAADGSTEIEIYYDRDYYLMTFDMAGGYGVEPIYARYGTPITAGTPTKPGYTFESWTPSIPPTMPANNTSYTANWQVGDAVNYTVVFWYENANDANYSYAGSVTQPAKAGTSVNSGTFRNTDFTGRDTAHFTYNSAKTETKTVAGDGSTVLNVYFTRNVYTLTFIGAGTERVLTCGYSYEHKHTYTDSRWVGTQHKGGCYGDDWEFSPKCGKTEHTHSNRCYGTGLTITAKYDADIHGNFPIKDGDKTILWSVPSGCSAFVPGTYLASINAMPGENITFTVDDKVSAANIYYYVETISGETGTHSYSGKSFKIYKAVKYTKNGYLTYSEEFNDIIGFTQWKSDPKFDKMEQGGKTSGINTNNYLYYTRNSYNLKFFNYNADVADKGGSVQFEAPLKNYNFEPAYPSTLEPNAYRFAGWYTTAGCYDGSEADLNTMIMPANDVTLYAKWVPVTHTVSFYLDETALASGIKLSGYSDQTVAHGSKTAPVPNPTNGDYKFICWFYKDGDTEKAFDFANMPVTRDMQVYGKWSSTVLKQYFVYYKEQGTDTEIAEPTTGSALAGNTKTFDAKGGNDLYEGYRVGYFPVTPSHSLKLDINNDANNVYVFEYVKKDAVPYTVKYLKAGTDEELKAEKVVADNRKAVVTENFAVIEGYMPDAYQKTLVVSVNEDGNPDTEHNVIIFYYTADTEHAYYKVTHYLQNLDGETYTEHKTKQAKGDIDERITEDPLTISGYTYNSETSNASGILTAQGLELKLYYDRNRYPYQVRYLEQGTNEVLAEATNGTDLYGKLISADAKTIPGYTCVSSAAQTCTIAIENGETAVKNVINFYYTENQATINYVVVGPDDCGTVTPGSETVKVVTGTATGSTAAVSSDNYKFVGWYSDPACTKPVPPAQVAGNKFTPAKDAASGLYVPATYYAKFEWNVADLTITKKAAAGTTIDDGQSFIFHVTGDDNDVDMYVTVQGAGRVIVKGLKVGDYTVTEMTSWSWRYTPADGAEKNVSVNGGQTNEVTFTNTRNNNKWLSGDSYAINYVGGIKASGTFVSGN